jgi:hypothetical protein
MPDLSPSVPKEIAVQLGDLVGVYHASFSAWSRNPLEIELYDEMNRYLQDFTSLRASTLPEFAPEITQRLLVSHCDCTLACIVDTMPGSGAVTEREKHEAIETHAATVDPIVQALVAGGS